MSAQPTIQTIRLLWKRKNAAYFGRGLVFNKYTGSRGKSGSNDASAEYMAEMRKVMDDADVSFQTAELGKVDAGGGGTIAYILGNLDMQVIDSGVAVLNMHAPWGDHQQGGSLRSIQGICSIFTQLISDGLLFDHGGK